MRRRLAVFIPGLLATAVLVSLPAGAAAAACPGASSCPYASTSSLGAIGDGVVRGPVGAALDSGGTLWVTDNWDNRVVGFPSSGPAVAFGSPGQAAGQFFDPRGIAVDPSTSPNDIYVADDNRIQKFDHTGQPLATLPTSAGGTTLGIMNALAVDGSGNVFAADGTNHRIVEFNSSGTFVQAWDGSGSGAGQFAFSDPAGIAVDASDHVFVTDQNNSEGEWFTVSGSTNTFGGTFGASGTSGALSQPTGIAVDGSDDLFVVNSGAANVEEFKLSGGAVTYVANSAYGSSGFGNGQFFGPQGIATNTMGNTLYVADNQNDLIQQLTNTAGTIAFAAQFGHPGQGQLDFPEGAALDSAGNVYVPESRSNRVQELTASGAFVRMWGANGGDGSSGGGDGEFNAPSAVAVDSSDHVYVADAGRVQVFDPTATPGPNAPEFLFAIRGTFGNPDFFSTPSGLAIDNAHHDLFVLDASANQVKEFAITGNCVSGASGCTTPYTATYVQTIGDSSGPGQLNFPHALAFSAGRLFIADTHNNRVAVYTVSGSTASYSMAFGAFGIQPGQMQSPQGIAVDAAGNILVSDLNDRVQVFDSTGTYKTGWGDSGFGDGEFRFPGGIAVGAGSTSGLDDVYVADSFGQHVRRFVDVNAGGGGTTCPGSTGGAATPNSAGLFTWDNDIAPPAASGSTFCGPEGVSVAWSSATNAHSVTIADTPNSNVLVRNPDGSTPSSGTTSYGAPGGASGQLQNPGQAVQVGSTMWVSDSFNGRVQIFTGSSSATDVVPNGGSFQLPRGIATDDAQQHVAVADAGSGSSGAVYVFTSGGAFVTKLDGGSGSGALKNPEGVAFDHAGHVWVADTQNSRLVEFDVASGNELATIGTGILNHPTGVAVDVFGNLWVADWGNDRLVWLSSSGSQLGTLTDAAANSALKGPVTVAIDPGNGDLFAADAGNDRVVRYTLPAPAAQTNPADGKALGSNSTWSATLHGTATPNDGPWDCQFEVWLADAQGNHTTLDHITPNACSSQALTPSAASGKLQLGQNYVYRLVVERPDGSHQAPGAFEPLVQPGPPHVTTDGGSTSTLSDLQVAGHVDPNGIDTHYYVQWGPDLNNMPNNTPSSTGLGLSGNAGDTQINPLDVTGLDLGNPSFNGQPTTPAEYCYRLVAYNGSGTTYGSDVNGGRGLCVPTVNPVTVTATATDHLSFSSRVSPEAPPPANVAPPNPENLATTDYFQYSTSPDMSNPGTAFSDHSPVTSPTDVTATAAGLSPGTYYYYRLVASSAAGTVYGQIGQAQTNSAPSHGGGGGGGGVNLYSGSSGPGLPPENTVQVWHCAVDQGCEVPWTDTPEFDSSSQEPVRWECAIVGANLSSTASGISQCDGEVFNVTHQAIPWENTGKTVEPADLNTSQALVNGQPMGSPDTWLDQSDNLPTYCPTSGGKCPYTFYLQTTINGTPYAQSFQYVVDGPPSAAQASQISLGVTDQLGSDLLSPGKWDFTVDSNGHVHSLVTTYQIVRDASGNPVARVGSDGTITAGCSGCQIIAAGAGNYAPTTDGTTVYGVIANADNRIVAIISAGGGNIEINSPKIIAAGSGNIIAAGAGNIIAAGAGNIIAAGAGNIISAGSGNIIAAGAGNIIAAGAGNIISAGGGNIIAAGAGNFAAGAVGNVVSDGPSGDSLQVPMSALPGTDTSSLSVANNVGAGFRSRATAAAARRRRRPVTLASGSVTLKNRSKTSMTLPLTPQGLAMLRKVAKVNASRARHHKRLRSLKVTIANSFLPTGEHTPAFATKTITITPRAVRVHAKRKAHKKRRKRHS